MTVAASVNGVFVGWRSAGLSRVDIPKNCIRVYIIIFTFAR